MLTLKTINLIALILISLCILVLVTYVYNNAAVQKKYPHLNSVLIRFPLLSLCAGSLLRIPNLSFSWPQFGVDVSIGVLLLWLVWFHISTMCKGIKLNH